VHRTFFVRQWLSIVSVDPSTVVVSCTSRVEELVSCIDIYSRYVNELAVSLSAVSKVVSIGALYKYEQRHGIC
jgi:hypothetical protein